MKHTYKRIIFSQGEDQLLSVSQLLGADPIFMNFSTCCAVASVFLSVCVGKRCYNAEKGMLDPIIIIYKLTTNVSVAY